MLKASALQGQVSFAFDITVPALNMIVSGIFAHVELAHVKPMGEKIFFVNFGGAPKARLWRDRHVTLTRPRFNILAFL